MQGTQEYSETSEESKQKHGIILNSGSLIRNRMNHFVSQCASSSSAGELKLKSELEV